MTTGLKRRGELCFDIDIEGSTVHRAVKQPGSGQLINAQPCNEGLGAPMAEGGIRFQTRAAGRSPAQARELGRHRRFVPRPAGDCNAICREGIKTNLCGSSRILGWARCRHSYRAARTRLRRLSVAIGRVASITGQARSTLTRENGQPTDSNLAQPSSVILLRARTPICASVF